MIGEYASQLRLSEEVRSSHQGSDQMLAQDGGKLRGSLLSEADGSR